MAGSGSLAIAPTAFAKLPYDSTKDFAPVALVAWISFVLVVNPALPIQSVADLIKYAKEKPGQLNYGSGGAGSPHQLLAEILKSMTGIEMAHVAYKGSSPALNDVIGGHIQLLFSDPLPSLPQIKAGNVRALGVSTAARWPTAPEIPTIAESGVPGFDAAGWGMVIVPGYHPERDRDATAFELNRPGSPEIQEQILKLGIMHRQLFARGAAAIHQFEIGTLGQIVRQVGLAGTMTVCAARRFPSTAYRTPAQLHVRGRRGRRDARRPGEAEHGRPSARAPPARWGRCGGAPRCRSPPGRRSRSGAPRHSCR